MQNREMPFVKYLLSLSMLLPASSAAVATAEAAATSTAEENAGGAPSKVAPSVASRLNDLVNDGDKIAWINWTEWDQSPPFSISDDDAAPRPSAASVLRDVRSEKA
jgi:hypothetical protein